MKLTIKQKLYVIVTLVVLSFLGLYFENASNQNKVTNLVEIKSELKDVQITMLQLRRSEKDFLLRKDTKYQQKFAKTFKHAMNLLANIEPRLVTAKISVAELSVIKTGLKNYQQIFDNLIEVSVAKGLDKDSGLYGNLRTATHELENGIEAIGDFESQVYLLTLRRHEKDFILRSDEKYVGRLSETANQLLSRLTNSDNRESLVTYVDEFNKYFEISKEIGLDSKSGIRGGMRAAVHSVEEKLNNEIVLINNYIEKNIVQTQQQHLIVTIVVLLLIIGVIILVARQIITPLNDFSRQISEIRKGNDLTQRTTDRHDEIGLISKEFNIFMAHFQSLIQSINQTVDSLSESSGVVSRSVAKTTEGIVNQSQESDMVATAVTEMGIVAGEIANNARMTKDKTDEASIKAVEGKEKLDSTVININELSEQLINAGEEIIQLQEKSNGITSVLEVIKGIADQTNLLALNAAIEAARAGEQGRGFAVVADEVRTLAVRTQDSTAEITSIINELQATTTSIVNTVNTCKEQGIDSVNQAKVTEEVLNEIITDVNAIADMTVLVATAVEEQSVVVKEVDENIIRIRDIGEQVANDSQENSQASDDVAALASELHEEASIFKI
jgi:methyl-accepting chemotaxis protein